MNYTCSIPIDLKVIEGKPKYSYCGKEAIYKVKNSNWYVCRNCANYIIKQNWELEELK